MKAITKKISLLLMLSAVLFLSSCLDSGSNSYIGNEEYSYITSSQTSGTVYARTLAGYLITSPKIQQLTPGTAAFLTYQVTEETPTVALEDNMIAYKVNLGGEPIVIDQTVLQMTTAPDVPAVNFESIMDPLYAQNQLFGDLWLFPYTYKSKKGSETNYFSRSIQEIPDIDAIAYSIENKNLENFMNLLSTKSDSDILPKPAVFLNVSKVLSLKNL